MALQNIGASNSDDAFYRYKMPKMITKIEGRGNGIKTNVVNMVDIAKALARPPSYTIKYFGCELGAQSKFDEKTGVSLVNGAHETAKLAALLENFIKKYVQCYGCRNPETEVIITKSQMIQLKCAACGFISDVDMRDKLTTFILKNPPEQKKGSKDKKAMRRAEKERLKEGEAADEENRKIKKEVKKKVSSVPSKDTSSKHSTATKKKSKDSDEDRSSPNGSQADGDEIPEDEDDVDEVQWQTDTSAEAARQRMQEQLSAVTAEMVMLSTDESEKKPKPVKVASATNGSAETKAGLAEVKKESTITKRGTLVSELKTFLKGGTSTQLQSHLASLSGSPQEIMDALFEALFGRIGKGFAKEVNKKKNFLAAATRVTGSQLLLLQAIRDFCETNSEAVKEVALVLKTLYDADVLEEEYILQWYNEGINGSTTNSSPVLKNAKPFMDWLETAESESEEE